LTTAATLWVAAAIGIACGAGYYSGAVIGTAITLLALWPLRFLAYHVVEYVRPEEQRMLVELSPETSVSELMSALEREHAHAESIQVNDELDRRVVTLTLDTPSQRLVAALSDLDFVKGVQWRR
jgi:putative Mg2+ transporter-C (MgtC) family protein